MVDGIARADHRGSAHRTVALIAMGWATATLATACAAQAPPPAAPIERSAEARSAGAGALPPTLDDGVSPSYEPNAPVRESVGQGHMLTGHIRSSRDGSPIAGARIELWPEYATKGHPDEARATVFSDPLGGYRFACDPPEHIHMRVSADGFITIGLNSYHPSNEPSGTLDVVLVPRAAP